MQCNRRPSTVAASESSSCLFTIVKEHHVFAWPHCWGQKGELLGVPLQQQKRTQLVSVACWTIIYNTKAAKGTCDTDTAVSTEGSLIIYSLCIGPGHGLAALHRTLMMAAICLPLPTPAPSPRKKPARSPVETRAGQWLWSSQLMQERPCKQAQKRRSKCVQEKHVGGPVQWAHQCGIRG